MTKSFLSQTCDYLKEHFSSLGGICLLTPSRRANFVLAQQLGIAALPEEAKPKLFSIEDFIISQSGLQQVEQVELLLEVQEVFKQVADIQQDNLMSWLPTLLRDFSRIDQQMIEAKQLFGNLADIGRVAEWQTDHSEKKPQSDIISHYFKFWDKLYEVYLLLNQQLKAKNKAYTGAMYRHLATHAQSLLVEHPVHRHYVFIGFNALSKAEEQIIKVLVAANKATLLWDSDAYYMSEHTENQAGIFLKKYRKDPKISGNTWLWEQNLLLSQEKDIEVIASPHAGQQAKVVQQLLQKWGNQSPTAIILPDENMLLPLMYSLDTPDINITMGLSLQNSTLYNLVSALFEMHQTSELSTYEKEVIEADGQPVLKQIQVEKYHYRNIIKILNHPFIRKFEQSSVAPQPSMSFIRDAVQHIVQRNMVMISSGEIQRFPDYLCSLKPPEERDLYFAYYERFSPLLKVIFGRWGDESAVKKALQTLQKLTEFFGHFYKDSNALEKHYIKKFREIVKHLKETLKERKYKIDLRSLKVFIYQLIREERVAFDSERNSIWQIMGLLETRALDFENIIILSMNEKTLPPAKKSSSLIPIDIAKAFELPTHAEQEAIISYHFYRLLQRAKRVALVHVAAASKTFGSEEVSRYVLQLENDLSKKAQGKIRIQRLEAQAQPRQGRESAELVIPKNEEFLAKIIENLEKGISPTQIDTFVRCSLKYYFEQIAGIQEANQVEEELGSDKLGTILHEVLEDIFREMAGDGQKILSHHLEAQKPKVKARVEEKFKDKKYKNYSLTGNNYLVQQVIIEYVLRFLEAQIQELNEGTATDTSFEILGLEARRFNPSPIENPQFLSILPASLPFRWKGQKLQVQIKGVIDRIDRLEGVLRIIDYKTGKVQSKELTIEESAFEQLASDKEMSKARQLVIYRYILLKNQQENPQFAPYKDALIEAGIYSMLNLSEQLIRLSLKNGRQVTDKKSLNEMPINHFLSKTEQFLEEVIRQMLDESQAFQKTDDLGVCEYCDYKGICGR